MIRNGGRLLVQGESAFVQVSRDAVYEAYPDPDAGSIDQLSTVAIAAGGRLDIHGEGASCSSAMAARPPTGSSP